MRIEGSRPPFFSTADERSFAGRTLRERKPAIVDMVIEENRYAGREKEALLALKDALLGGGATGTWRSRFRTETGAAGLRRGGMEKNEAKTWRRALRPHAGKSRLELPFYLAEALFYLDILLAVGYFDRRSPRFGMDPFEVFKRRELFQGGGVERGRLVVSAVRGAATPEERISVLVSCSLWGNRADLSLFQVADRARGRDPLEKTERPLIDHRPKLVELLEGARRVDFILDNGGQELVCDLLLAHELLSRGSRVFFHAKKHPFYVSDARGKDVAAAIAALAADRDPALSAVGGALSSLLAGGTLAVREHYFWNGPLHFPDLPGRILAELGRSDLVVLKGDVNYRRLVSDREWPTDASLDDIASFFPAPCAVLRTMKSDAVVDIAPERAAALDREDPEWRVNGERGIVRVVERRAR